MTAVLSAEQQTARADAAQARPAADCELWLAGRRAACTRAELAAGIPTALDGLSVTWGRGSVTEQPDVGTCAFTLHDEAASVDLLTVCGVGTPVEVYATGAMPAPEDEVILAEGWDSDAPGELSPNRYQAANLGSVQVVQTDRAGRVLRATPRLGGDGTTYPPAVGLVVVPPLPFAPAGTDPTAWDSIPQLSPGRTWTVSVRVRPPLGCVATLGGYGTTTPWQAEPRARSDLDFDAGTVEGDGGWHLLTGTVTTAGVPVWPLVGVETLLPDPQTWDGLDLTGSWDTDPVRAWNDGLVLDVDDLQVAVSGDVERRVLVFAGRVTDAVAQPVGDHRVQLRVTAADLAATLENDVVGDEPWPVQSVEARMRRILDLARYPVGLHIDPALTGYRVSIRDVNAQPVLGLLQDLAQTAGGVLWVAGHTATEGGYLWLEDTETRASVRELALDPDSGLVVIGGSTRNVALISARDILRDPVRLTQSVAEVVSTVNVIWSEQIVEDGKPGTVERYATVTDADAVAAYGLRRLSVTTELTDVTDAMLLANRMLARSRQVNWRVDGYDLDTHRIQRTIPTLPNAARMQALMDLLDATTRIGLALTLIELPDYLPSDVVASVYVEGGTYTFADGDWRCELTLSPSGGQGSTGRWAELPPPWRWVDADPGIRWYDLYGVAAPQTRRRGWAP